MNWYKRLLHLIEEYPLLWVIKMPYGHLDDNVAAGCREHDVFVDAGPYSWKLKISFGDQMFNTGIWRGWRIRRALRSAAQAQLNIKLSEYEFCPTCGRNFTTGEMAEHPPAGPAGPTGESGGPVGPAPFDVTGEFRKGCEDFDRDRRSR